MAHLLKKKRGINILVSKHRIILPQTLSSLGPIQ